MIRLSRLTDYAVSLLSHMGQEPNDALWAASNLSAASGLPMPTVAKVLKLLAKNGVIKAQRGATGGYRLARSTAQISIAEIIEAMDGPISITDCARGAEHSDCSVHTHCPASEGWHKVNNIVRQALINVSLAEISGPSSFAFQIRKEEARQSAG